MRNFLKKIVLNILNTSLYLSNLLRGEKLLKTRLSEIVPDLSKQYSTFTVDMNNCYLVNKIRGQHTFQMSLALEAVSLLKKEKEANRNVEINIVDIGDSSGTHLIYLNSLLKDDQLKTLSVNLDPIAVDKIKSKGLNALLCRAEELHTHENGLNADIFLSYEMLEHLIDPIGFLHTMSEQSECKYFVVTVPYVHRSRIACQFVQNQKKGNFQAENTHIFELSPDDWNTIFKFTGWEIVYSDKYTQYPSVFPFNMIKYLWRKVDFDGFYGVILKKNNFFSKRYTDW